MYKKFTTLVIAMKLVIFLLIVSMVQVSASTFGQQVTLSERQVTYERVFREIRKQTGFDILVQNTHFDTKQRIDVHFKATPLEAVLEQLVAGTPMDYVVQGKKVVIRGSRRSAGVSAVETQDFASPPQETITLRGTVVDSTGSGLAGVTIFEEGGKQSMTDGNGRFTLPRMYIGATLRFQLLGHTPLTVTVRDSVMTVRMNRSVSELEEVVVLNTGYQNIPKERATGSFVHIDNELLNRRVSTNVLDRLDGVTSGLIFNRNLSGQPNMNESAISIRGRSTIFANPNPLIVLDDFPYEGNIDNLNPNDIESVTVLKDAAAASIWGANSGNGVIVITTKKGAKNQKTKVSATSSVNIINKPDLYYLPQLTSSQVIEAEKFLYENGRYNSLFTNFSRPYISPVVEILRAESDPAIAESLIAPYRNIDNRADLGKYVYHQSINQQHALSLSGGGQANQYYLSVGYDENKGNMVNDLHKRLTVSARNTFSFLDDKIRFSSGLILTNTNTSRTTSNANPIPFSSRPYERLVDDNGNAVPVNYQYRSHYIDTVGQGLLLDWNYRPLDELRNSDNRSSLTDYRINSELKYQIVKGLDIQGIYQYSRGVNESRNLYDVNSYHTRNLINRYSQINYGNGSIVRPIPLGDILDASYEMLNSHQFRLQANLNKAIKEVHNIAAIAGYERRSMTTQNNPQVRLYGYNPDTEASALIDFTEQYTIYSGFQNRIPQSSLGGSRFSMADNNISYYSNANYTYANRYMLSGSARFDQSNIFGVKTNQKGVPLWSIGGAWNIHEETFYNVSDLPYLKLRLTYGYNGNVDKSTSAYVTSGVSLDNYFGRPTLRIVNPPNTELRWEQIQMLNFGLDFRSIKGRINGSVDYYRKKGKDLIGDAPFAPQTGIIRFRGNIADISGQGLDVLLHTENLTGILKWRSTLLYNYTQDKVVDYKLPVTTVYDVLSNLSLSPINGKPLYSMYSYKWAGLDNSGNPQGLIDDQPSNNYPTFFQSDDFGMINYHGSAHPIHFGSIRNTLGYKGIELSFNILYKMGYYFRERLSQNVNPFNGYSVYPNFDNRWKLPGDELITNVPSLINVVNASRQSLYELSELHVNKADHIRLQDIQISYELGAYARNMGINRARLFFYANNMGILWKAHKGKIDPDFSRSIPNPRSYAMGLSINL